MAKYVIEVVKEGNPFWSLVKWLFWIVVLYFVARACVGG